MLPEFRERGSSYDMIYENISLILGSAKIYFVVSVVKLEELCVSVRYESFSSIWLTLSLHILKIINIYIAWAYTGIYVVFNGQSLPE